MRINIIRLIEEVVNDHNPKIKLSFTPEEREFLKTHLQEVIIPKGKLLMKEGDTEKSLYFLEKGVVRVWFSKYEKEQTFRFITEKDFINFYYAMKHKEASLFNVETSSDCIIWKIQNEPLKYLMDKSLNVNKMARVYLERFVDHKIKREIGLLTQSPEERYKDLLSEERKLVLYLPLKQIASYLGITPQALSNIRRRIFIFT